jgi:high-affinity iron transporter
VASNVGVIPSLIIGLREGIEAALVIGIFLGYLAKIERPDLRRHVYVGTVSAGFASAGIAGVLFAMSIRLAGPGELLFEGIAMLVAVAVITSMVLWMMKASRSIKIHVQQKIDAALSDRRAFSLSLLAFVVVLREGIETALLVFGVGELTSLIEAVIGIGLGLLVAGIIGVGIVRVSWRLNLKRFFQVTGVFLVIIAAGLFAHAVHELQEASGSSFAAMPLYDLSVAFPHNESNPVGYLLRGIVGYSANPTVLEGAAYLAYWIVLILVYLGIRSGRIAIVSDPLRRAWRALVGRRREPNIGAQFQVTADRNPRRPTEKS